MVCSLKPQHAACLDNISVWIEVPRLFPPILVSSSRTVSGTIVKATNSDVMSSKCCDWTFFWGGFWVFLPMCFLDPGLQETPSTVQSVQPIDWRGVSPICNLSVNIRTMSKKRCGRVSEMDFTITFLRIVYLQSKNVRWVIENPATSLLWRYRCIRDAWALVQACLNLQYFFFRTWKYLGRCVIPCFHTNIYVYIYIYINILFIYLHIYMYILYITIFIYHWMCTLVSLSGCHFPIQCCHRDHTPGSIWSVYDQASFWY